MEKIDKDIKKATLRIAQYKEQLKRKVNRQQICEDFGQDKVKKLEDEFSNYRYNKNVIWDAIILFNNWCKNYTKE